MVHRPSPLPDRRGLQPGGPRCFGIRRTGKRQAGPSSQEAIALRGIVGDLIFGPMGGLGRQGGGMHHDQADFRRADHPGGFPGAIGRSRGGSPRSRANLFPVFEGMGLGGRLRLPFQGKVVR